MIDEKRIEEIVQTVVQALSPLRVLLYGSYARGDFHEESDLNLCVILPTAGEWIYRPHEFRQRVPAAEVAVEPLVLTAEEHERLLREGHPLLQQLREEGRVLYEQQ
jgi:predicted nucleotidyltransferase